MRFNSVIRFIVVLLLGIFALLTTSDMNISSFTNARTDVPIKFHEKDYVNKYCNGFIEYTLDDRTRIDCLTDEYAIEFDYAKKWAESIGQSLYYAKKTGKKPAVAIILKKKSDEKYVQRIREVDKEITIFEIPAIDYKIDS